MNRFRNKSFAALIGAVMVVVFAGVAFAYWTAGGSGSGTAATGTNTTMIANQLTTVTAMGPGDSPQNLSGDFTNSSDGPVYVNSVTASISGVVKADGVSGTCDETDYSLVNPVSTVNEEVPVGPGVGAWGATDTPTIQFNNKTTIQDACKGATVYLSYVIS